MGCSVTGCTKPYYSRDYCRKHYVRWRRHGDSEHVGKPGPPRRTCNIPDCPGGQVGQGLCDKHYRRLRRWGDPFEIKRIIGDIEARWWSHVERHHVSSACWPWTACIDDDGYGRFWDGERVGYAARWGYERFVGPFPGGRVPDHLCHDPETCVSGSACPHRACVNYRHLQPVTNRENSLRGGRTFLSDQEIAILYALWKAGRNPVDELAATAGVNKTTLYRRFHRLENT